MRRNSTRSCDAVGSFPFQAPHLIAARLGGTAQRGADVAGSSLNGRGNGYDLNVNKRRPAGLSLIAIIDKEICMKIIVRGVVLGCAGLGWATAGRGNEAARHGVVWHSSARAM